MCCLKNLEECCERRESIILLEKKKQYASFEAEFGAMQVELKKKTIRALLDQKNLEKVQNSHEGALKEIADLKSQLCK